MRATVEVYRTVFGLEPTDPAVGPRQLAAIQHNGGAVIGAFDGERLAGFVYGFLGRDSSSGQVYLYSQTAAVLPEYQGTGVGRALKLGQRDYVVSTGVERMRWSYDPMRTPNAHFNLDVLGARGRWFVRNLYGLDDIGRDAGLPSDRMIVEWDLVGEPNPPYTKAERPLPAPAAGLAAGSSLLDGDRLLVAVPRSPTRSAPVRASVSDGLDAALAQGWIACSCMVVDDTTACYVLLKETA